MCFKLNVIMRETLPYIWWKHNIQLLPQTLLVNDTLEGVRRAVHVETFLAAHEWERYLRKHFRNMIADQKSFGRYTVFACLLEFEHIENPLDRYIRILAMGAYFALYCHARQMPYGVYVLPWVLDKFFEVKMSDLTVDKEFLTKLGNHIIRKGYLRHQMEVDRMLRDGRSKQDVLEAVTRECTRTRLASNGERMASVDSDFIEEHQLTDEIVSFLDKIVFQPVPRGPPPKKMGMPQKLNAASDLKDDIKKVSLKLQGYDRLLTYALANVENEMAFKGGVIQAPLMEIIPDQLILNCLLKIYDYL